MCGGGGDAEAGVCGSEAEDGYKGERKGARVCAPVLFCCAVYVGSNVSDDMLVASPRSGPSVYAGCMFCCICVCMLCVLQETIHEELIELGALIEGSESPTPPDVHPASVGPREHATAADVTGGQGDMQTVRVVPRPVCCDAFGRVYVCVCFVMRYTHVRVMLDVCWGGQEQPRTHACTSTRRAMKALM